MFSASSSGSVPRRIVPADRAGLHPVAGHPDVHLRGRADQALPLAQVEDELIGRRVALPQQLVERGRRGTWRAERLARHHLEQVAAGKTLLRPLHRAGVRTRLRPRRKIIMQNGWRVVIGSARGRRVPGQASRGHAVHGELVGVPDRGLPLAVHDVQFVRQMQDQVALAPRPVAAQRNRLELEREIVAERAVEPKVRIGAREGVHHRTHGGEDRGALAPVLLGHQAGRLGDDDRHLALRDTAAGRAAGPVQGGGKHGQDDLAARVEGTGHDGPAVRHDLRTGVHIGELPAAVPARVLHPGAEHSPAPAVHLRADVIDVRGAERLLGAGQPHPAAGDRLG